MGVITYKLPSGFKPNKITTLNLLSPTISYETQKQLKKEAEKRIKCEYKWPEIDRLKAWMVTSETSSFMLMGGLAMVAADMPEAFNNIYNPEDEISIVTPLYTGSTVKKSANLEKSLINYIYHGTEGNKITINKALTIDIKFYNKKKKRLEEYPADIYYGRHKNTKYIFIGSDTFFSINPHKNNPSGREGCYVLNENDIDETERYAFFSKAVFELLKNLIEEKNEHIERPNVIIANDWHASAISGLTRYLTPIKKEKHQLSKDTAEALRNTPIVHITHHLGYQGWDFKNTSNILNSLYEDYSSIVYENANNVKTSNKRTKNTVIVGDTYNHLSCDVALADRLVSVSENYCSEITKEDIPFGYDFKELLEIRKKHNTLTGIVNGYEKFLISPNPDKINDVNNFFDFNRKFFKFDENSLDIKNENKKVFIKLLSKLIKNPEYKKRTLPLLDFYKFDDLIEEVKDSLDETPILSATSRLAPQKGYDITADAIIDMAKDMNYKNLPIFILGGAGSEDLYKHLTDLKDKLKKKHPKLAKRVYVFKGFNPHFAYAIQLISDFYIMSCKFEPCGLTQMEAMAKGAIPIATSTGGLVDTIIPGVDGYRTDVFYSEKGTLMYGEETVSKKQKTNFEAFKKTMKEALDTFYNNPKKHKEVVVNAMLKDFSWSAPKTGSAHKYYKLLKTGEL